MKFVFSKKYKADIGTHVFPTDKYIRILERLRSEGLLQKEQMVEPCMPTPEELAQTLENEYLDDLLAVRMSWRTASSELPVKQDIISAQMLSCDGSFQAAHHAREAGAAYHIGGGFHHAFRDHAEGFCYLNDVAYAAVRMLNDGCSNIAVVDLDLHQGNGTAGYFEHDTRVFTFSMHQERLYPKKERSDLDIGLDHGVEDGQYLALLDRALDKVYEEFRPELVLYVAGADPYVLDQLGSLCLTVEGLRQRDEMVVCRAHQRGISVAVMLGGGYAQDINDTVEIHCNTARELVRAFAQAVDE
jgi:acetoin utilization deacetylase AcuC-like enzyme